MNDVLAGALIGVISVLLGILFEHRFSLQREAAAEQRRRENRFWDRRVDTILDIERKAALLFDRVTGYRSPNDYTPSAQDLYADLENLKGAVIRYKDVWAALNDFNHAAAILISDWQKWDTAEDRQRQIADIDVAMGRLNSAIDGIPAFR